MFSICSASSKYFCSSCQQDTFIPCRLDPSLMLFKFNIIEIQSMQNRPLRQLFSRTYSFIPHPNAYTLLVKQKQLFKNWETYRVAIMSKVPANLRMSRMTAYEKAIISVSILFFFSVKFLENYG